jgi:hypothetical protein
MAFYQATQDSTTPLIDFGRTTAIDNLAPLSAFCWARMDVLASTIANSATMLGKSNSVVSGGNALFAIGLEADGVGTGNNASLTASRWSTQLGAWVWDGPQDTKIWHAHLTTYSYSSTSDVPLYYLDGAQKSLVSTLRVPTGSLNAETSDVCIGNNKSSDADSFPGALAQCAIWNAILTPLEAQLLAGGVPPPLIRPDALVFYCPCSADPTQALGLGRTQLGMASVTGTWLPADDPLGLLLPARGEAPVAFSPSFQSLPYRRPNMPLYRR